MRGLFVTGTDTDCGKTFVALTLIRALRARGLRVAGFKPVAAGADWRDGQLQNDDALALAQASGLAVPYATVNPYCFEPAIAPHLAAAEVGAAIDPATILTARDRLATACDFVVTEGAGGWLVPLGARLDMSGLALALGYPVLLVVGIRLGCLNHALLTAQAIQRSGAHLLGWVGTQVDPGMARLNANIDALVARLPGTCLGILPHPDSREPLARQGMLSVDALLATG